MVTLAQSLRPPKYWQDRADEARQLADQMSSAKAKAAMLDVVASYEQLAQIAAGVNKEAADATFTNGRSTAPAAD